MKRLTMLSLALTALVTFTSLATADASTFDRRARVHQGVRHGQLTRAEWMRLYRAQREFDRLQRMAWADGRLSRGEQRMLQRARVQLSREIFRLKHNGRYA